MNYLRWFCVTAPGRKLAPVFVEAYSREEARLEARQHPAFHSVKWLEVRAGCWQEVQQYIGGKER